MVDWKPPNLRDLSPSHPLPKQANPYYITKRTDFALLDSQDSVIGEHYLHLEHAFQMSFTGVFEKRVTICHESHRVLGRNCSALLRQQHLWICTGENFRYLIFDSKGIGIYEHRCLKKSKKSLWR